MNKSLNVRAPLLIALFLATLSVCKVASAAAIDILIGDKDGFGFGLGTCPDTGTCPNLSNPPIDNRSAAEAAATNGAQFTDVYSALFSGEGPNPSSGSVIFSFSGTLTDATISFAAGDFQSDAFGALSANINGISTPFFFADGRFVTAIHSITLTPAELAAANLAGSVDLNLSRNGSGDFIAFDWFELTGDTGTTPPVPEPSTLVLFGTGLLGFAATVRSKLRRA